MGYTVSDDAKNLIKKFEDLKLESYLCPAGIPTIGYGHTGPDVRIGMKISLEAADTLFNNDINKFSTLTSPLILVPLNSDQFGALVSFVFNLGTASLKKSTLLKKINSNEFREAGNEFLRWNKAKINGNLVILNGLTRRRQAERDLFLRGVS